MTLDEALAELGLEAGADPETVRRSYLRLIKVRKPETDPQGFKRARQAYDIARAETRLQAFAFQAERRYESEPIRLEPLPSPPEEPAAAPPEEPAAVEPEPPAPSLVEPEEAAEEAEEEEDADEDDAGESEPVHAPPIAVSFDGFLTVWQAVHAMDRFKKLKIAREAVAALPGDPRAYWLVVSSMSGFMEESSIAEALRAGYKAGFEEFLEALLIRVPHRVFRAELKAALESPTPSLRLLGAAVGADRDSELSSALVVEMCAEAERGDPTRLPFGPLIEAVLALHETEKVTPALRAHKAVRRMLRETGLELELLSTDVAPIWTVTEELASLPSDSPIGLRRAFAAAARAGDLTAAYQEAYDAVSTNRAEMARWTDRLKGAPSIAGVMHTVFAYHTTQRRSEVRSGFFRAAFYALLAVAAILILKVTSGSHSTDAPPIVALEPAASVHRTEAPLELAWQAGTELCGDDWKMHERLSCDDVHAMLAALLYSHCDTTGPMLQALKKKLDGRSANEREARVLTRIEDARRQICGEAP